MRNVQYLDRYISNEFHNLKTNMEQRSFIENFRFLAMASDTDFKNFYSHNALSASDFYSIADTLYQLNNFWILSEFLHQHRQILFNEVHDMNRKTNSPDFYTLCKFGQDTLFTRISKVFESHSVNLYAVAEEPFITSSCTRKLKVYSSPQKNDQSMPQIILQGKWVEQYGFSIGSNIRVDCYEDKLIINNITIPLFFSNNTGMPRQHATFRCFASFLIHLSYMVLTPCNEHN